MRLVSFPSKSLDKGVRGLKGFNVGVARGLDVNGVQTTISRQGNSHSYIFLISIARQQVTLKPGIRGRCRDMAGSKVGRWLKRRIRNGVKTCVRECVARGKRAKKRHPQ